MRISFLLMIAGFFVVCACSKKKSTQANEKGAPAKPSIAPTPLPKSLNKAPKLNPESGVAESPKSTSNLKLPPSGGAETPEAVGLAYVAGFNGRDKALVNALFATPKVIESAIECPNRNRIDRIERERIKTSNEMSRGPSTAKMIWKGLTTNKRISYRVGQMDGPCKFLKPVEMNRLEWRLKIGSEPTVKEVQKTATIIRVDGRWYLVDL